MSCPLCEAKKITRRYHEDRICWVADCSTHQDKKIIVLKRHVSVPLISEMEHMMQIARKLFPGKVFRGPRSILSHFHLHSVKSTF